MGVFSQVTSQGDLEAVGARCSHGCGPVWSDGWAPASLLWGETLAFHRPPGMRARRPSPGPTGPPRLSPALAV